VIDSALYASEAQLLEIATSDYIAREVTNKLKTYSDEETEQVQAELRKKLYPKYRVKFFLDEPTPFIQTISVDDDPSLGKTDAPVTVVMFTDFQCPTCSLVYPILKRVIGEYGDKIRLVVRDFPLERIHENAFQAAIAANAANAQGKYFEYKEILYKNQESLDTESLKKYAGQIGLDVKKFENDLKDEKFKDEIRNDLSDGKKYGVNGTPSIFVNGYKIRGLSATSFRKAIDRALKN
jgi:protein-disulfide isomerase